MTSVILWMLLWLISSTRRIHEARRPRDGRDIRRFRQPRPALVIQSDHFGDTGTIVVLLVSGTLIDAPPIRLTIQPTADNGLGKASQIMVDKPISAKREKIGRTIGHVDEDTMLSVTRSLAVFLGFA